MPVLITNNSNTHPPEAWAVATAQLIFDVGADVASNRRIPALKLQTAIAEMLVAHYQTVQADEQSKLNADSDNRFAAPHDVEDYLDDAVADVVGCAKDTPWAPNFADRDMQAKIRAVLADHFATTQHIHRQAHARANPALPAGQAFMKALHSGGPTPTPGAGA